MSEVVLFKNVGTLLVSYIVGFRSKIGGKFGGIGGVGYEALTPPMSV